MANKGSLHIISTPIGNLSDISFRAIETLQNVDLILSEDTRETDKILKHYKINTPQISYRDQNHDRVFEQIVSKLEDGQSLALISDSGTPLISDPGYKLVRELIQKGFEITHLPGASAVISALVVSGLPTDKFVFLGFLPKSNGPREKMLQNFGTLDATIIIYESPYRILKLLEEINSVLGDRYICLVKDQTKMFENITRGKVSDILMNVSSLKLKGEFVVLVAKEGIYL